MSLAVIVPFYKHSAWLPDCIQSIRKQVHFGDGNHILLMNDDPNIDLSSYHEFPTLFVKQDEQNKGQSARYNEAIQIVHDYKYDWVAFCGADDMWMDWRMEIFNNLIKKDIDIIYTDAIQLNGDGSRRYIKSNDFDYNLLKQKNFIVASTVFIRTEIAVQCLFDEDVRYGEDWLWYLKLAQITKRWQYVNLPTVYYRDYTSTIVQKCDISQWMINKQSLQKKVKELYG